MASPEEYIPPFIDHKVDLADGRTFELIRPLNSYRSCHDGTPQEARMVFICKETTRGSLGEEFVLKVKVQLPAAGQIPEQGPSTTTVAEIQALEKFKAAKIPFAPHFVAFHRKIQDESGPLPNGFINYIIMTKLPGSNLYSSYFRLNQAQRGEIVPRAVEALRSIYDVGIEPVDRGLRNVMWDPDTKYCGIVDFEIWTSTNSTFANETTEMQRWGLVKTPPARDHFAAFNAMYRYG